MDGSSPPPTPTFAAVGVWSDTADGSRWRWTGSAWELVDPPGTHTDVMREYALVFPLFRLAADLERDSVPLAEAVARLRERAGSDVRALLEAAEMIGESQQPRVLRLKGLLQKAADEA